MTSRKPTIRAKIWNGICYPFKKMKNWLKFFFQHVSLKRVYIGFTIYLGWRRILKDERLYSCPPPGEQRDLFAQYVKSVDIEVFSFCNRRCWFCPNSSIDRHSQNIIMPDEMYGKILNELAEISYSGKIWFTRYNETFSDRIILDRIREARQKLPNATLHAYTNGDYITREYLDEIANAGLDDLHIMRYPQSKDVYDEQQQIDILIAYAKKLDYPFKLQNDISAKVFHPSMAIEIVGMNMQVYVCNRADSVTVFTKPYRRTFPCHYPFTNMQIDHNGSVMPCCNTRSDAPQHAEMIMGNVAEKTLFEIYSNFRYSLLRYQMREVGYKVYPCNACDAKTLRCQVKEIECSFVSKRSK